MSSGWLNGVISGCYDGSTRRTFFVTTQQGIAVVYPRIHEYHPDVRVGVSVSVKVSPPRSHSKNMEVDDMNLISTPNGLEIDVSGNEMRILCQSSFMRKEFEWLVFYNKYLGGMVKRRGCEMDERMNETGELYEVVCRRVRAEDRVPSRVRAYWVIQEICTANKIESSRAKSSRGYEKGESEEKKSENKSSDITEKGGMETTRKSIIPHMRKLLMDENVCRLFANQEKKAFERIIEICYRS